MRRRKKSTKINLSYLLIITIIVIITILFKSMTFKKITISPAPIIFLPQTNNNTTYTLDGQNTNYLLTNIARNKNINYFFNRKALAKNIFLAQSEIIRITFKPNYISSTLKITAQSEKIVAKICSDECFLLGEHGYIFNKQDAQNNFQITSNLKIYDNSVLKPQISTAFNKIFEISNLKSIPIQTAEILLNEDLKITTKDGWYILIDPNQNIEKQIKKLNYFLDNKKENLDKFQYIDLRIPQKIFYK